MKVALVYDWLTEPGGGERVLAELHALFPDAPIFTTLYDPRRARAETGGWDIRPSFLQRIPLARTRHRAFLPLMQLAIEEFDLEGFDVVVSVSSAVAKGAIAPAGTPHVCYCLTPCRYIWDLYHEYTRGKLIRPFFAPFAHWMRVWDRSSSERIDRFLTISDEIAGRVRRHYGRASDVVYPPVDVERFHPTGEPPEDFLLVVSRLVPYKRIDLAVAAAKQLRRRLLVVGSGPEEKRLRAMAGPTVEFLGRRSDEEVAELMARCTAFLFPGFEDFGIAPVEVQAAGRPVVAYGRGGALETVVDGVTGTFFEEATVASLVDAIERLETGSFSPVRCRENAERFSSERFRAGFMRAIEQEMEIKKRAPMAASSHMQTRTSRLSSPI
jgi:glycosyltransferase involved in cell wall biosynthesis